MHAMAKSVSTVCVFDLVLLIDACDVLYEPEVARSVRVTKSGCQGEKEMVIVEEVEFQ